ncbi:MAG: methylenetetrahydrofolate--tRNA-(uracil(54)-C(5))-methyltransferase (FADH(2)-oxidizing) TrmFO [Oscillospiraceae bacterium]|nr:methylenetetrahydrofolate--tRNA-(uracil(54)-C(5))-methyltransferase (FADH(2)-oxidizing) TrmFO [Oscillospiraceae bacterium]
MEITVIGGGLAGCEAAWILAKYGFSVTLREQKPLKHSPAHKYDGLAELVCSNSLKASRLDSASGLLKEEMRLLGSLILPCAEETAVAAGGALAVDRYRFSDLVTRRIRENPRIRVEEGEAVSIGEEPVIVATGPLTDGPLAEEIVRVTGSGRLSFFDAAAPIVTADSIDRSIVFAASRYGRGEDDYLNCPMNKEEYETFYDALVSAESAELHAFDKESFRVYEGCMPVEVMARRGPDTIRFGPLKPVGLRDPRTGHRPWAVVQLRKENEAGTLYNLVGFQTNLKWGEQKRVFSMIPGLQEAEFVRYGVMHRNTFLDSPRLLDRTFRLKGHDGLYFAGQMTGVEGYMESAASGLLCGHHLARRLLGLPELQLPHDTMLGALSDHVVNELGDFQPMGANMGILPPLPERIRDKKERYGVLAERAMASLRQELQRIGLPEGGPTL